MSNCTGPYIGWINSFLGECAYSTTEVASVVIGLTSIIFWLFAQSPQIYENFKNARADSLSFLFLLQWIAGDTLNLVSCFLTNQLATQRYTAGYFCFIDLVLLWQYVFYTYLKPWAAGLGGPKYERVAGDDPEDAECGKASIEATAEVVIDDSTIDDEHSTSTEDAPLLSSSADQSKPGRLLAVANLACVGTLWLARSALAARGTSGAALYAGGRRLQEDGDGDGDGDEEVGESIGLALAWACAALYLGSRVPQIIKNFQRKSVDGLSPLMFMFALMGNLTYATSILLKGHDIEFLFPDRVPFLVGSLGTIAFDLTVLAQFAYFTRWERGWFRRLEEEQDAAKHPHEK